MKRMLKSIITAMLCMAIALTGIGIDHNNAVTATAATKKDTLDKFVNGGTITMKPGDKKRILVQDKNGNDIAWKHSASSDESVVEVESDFVDTSVDLTECIVLIAKSTGTATVYAGGGMKMKVTVTKPKMTAAQKKCKHKFKVIRKATCERVGVKRCKLCYVNTKLKLRQLRTNTLIQLYTLQNATDGTEYSRAMAVNVKIQQKAINSSPT